MRLILLLILLQVQSFGQTLSNEIIEYGQNNADNFLKTILTETFFKEHIRKDYNQNSVSIHRDGQFSHQSFDSNLNGTVFRLYYCFNLVDKNQVITSIQVVTDKNGEIKTEKKVLKNDIKPYVDLINGLIKIDLNKMIGIAQENGFNKEKFTWTLDKELGKLIWTVTEKEGINFNKVIQIDAATGDIVSNTGELIME